MNLDINEEAQCVVELQNRTLSKLRQMVESYRTPRDEGGPPEPEAKSAEASHNFSSTISNPLKAAVRAFSSLSRSGSAKASLAIAVKCAEKDGDSNDDEQGDAREESHEHARSKERLSTRFASPKLIRLESLQQQFHLDLVVHPPPPRAESLNALQCDMPATQTLSEMDPAMADHPPEQEQPEPQGDSQPYTEAPPPVVDPCPSPLTNAMSSALPPRRSGILSPGTKQRFLFSSMPVLGRKNSEILPSQLKVFIVTWNVGNAMPLASEMNAWITPHAKQCDIIAVGLQESVFKSPKEENKPKKNKRERSHNSNNTPEPSLHMPRQGSIQAEKLGRHSSTHALNKALNNKVLGRAKKHDKLESLIKSHVGSAFSSIRRARMGAIRLLVFVKTELRPLVSDVSKTSKATGIGGVIGNKGGVALKFSIAGTELCFLSCHLAAHEDKVNRRNQDLQDIFKAASEGLDKFNTDVTNKYHHTFVFGDLNYRIDLDNVSNFQSYQTSAPSPSPLLSTIATSSGVEEGSVDQLAVQESKSNGAEEEETEDVMAMQGVVRMIQNKELYRLFEGDQLMCEMKANRVLKGFRETRPTFQPTFKCVRGNVGMTYNGQRTPSYCDRILWSSLPGHTKHITQTVYAAAPNVTSSDHKPVFSVFDIELPNCFADHYSAILPSFRGRKAQAEINFSRLKVLSLKDVCRASDVVVRFWGNVLQSEKSVSAREPGDNEPNFLTDLIVDPPTLSLTTMGRALLGHHVFIGLWDKSKKPMRMIGQAVLSLDDWVNCKHQQTCVMALMRFGVQVGDVSGTMTLSDPSVPMANVTPSFAQRFKGDQPAKMSQGATRQ
eukprot:c20833_g1_i1.p1 GENE.c20833_g1_i1~~c20833_g1_i1.p1  ORF type:complete len:835 (+),score=212.35 c20833_g1_i1:127-2631(+)